MENGLEYIETKNNDQHLALQEELDMTEAWLEEIFPKIFAADDYLPLDHQILCELKNHYRHYRETKGYPKNLKLAATIRRYLQNICYLTCLVEGAPRYNLNGKIVGHVSAKEAEQAKKILIKL